MRSFRYSVFMFLAIPILSAAMIAQQAASQASAVVPRLVNFAGKAADAQGKVISGVAGVTFAIYKDQSEGAPLWLETQNVTADAKGNYAVQLGASKSGGLPLELFSSGEARWLGVRVNEGPEQPRVLLLSVPYALKAEDAATLGGLPPSAFVLAGAPITGSGPATSASSSAAPQALPPATVTGSGTTNFVPLWNGASTVGNSVLFQSGTGATAKVGFNTTAPAATLDVKGTAIIRGLVALPAGSAATPAGGKPSQGLNFTTSVFNSTTSTAVGQTFRWQAEPMANNTGAPTGTMNLLFGAGASSPAETGLKISHTGQITFAPGQNFPGTVTSVGLSAPTADFGVTGSPVTGNGTLGLHWKVAPTSADTANAIVKRDASGNFAATVITAYNVTANNSSGAAIVGHSTGTSGGSDGVDGVTSSTSASGVAGVNTGDGIGLYGSGGIGVYGTSSTQQAVWGETYATGFANGSGPDGVHGVTHSANGSGVGGINWADGGVGVWGEAPTGIGFYTPNNVQQARTASGWIKAMALVNANSAPYSIVRCFNSALAGAAATTPPCGINFTEDALGVWQFDFGFQVNDRFLSVTRNNNRVGYATAEYVGTNSIEVVTWDPDGILTNDYFTFFIY